MRIGFLNDIRRIGISNMPEIILGRTDDKPVCDHMPVSATNTLKYVGTAIKDTETIYFWQCKLCDEFFEKAHFRYTQTDCPQHMWEFMGWEFIDHPHRYKLDQIYSCFMCGVLHREPYDVRSRGMQGGVPDGIEHPEVQRALFLTEDAEKRLLKE
jgi:hypothetical protein